MPKFLKLLISVGRGVYELYDEYCTEKRINAAIDEKARRVQSQRYQEASKTAGPKRTLH